MVIPAKAGIQKTKLDTGFRRCDQRHLPGEMRLPWPPGGVHLVLLQGHGNLEEKIGSVGLLSI